MLEKKHTKQYTVIYNNHKRIEIILCNKNSNIITKNNFFTTDVYQELIDFIYNNNLFKDNDLLINYDELEELQPNAKETLFKYDD